MIQAEILLSGPSGRWAVNGWIVYENAELAITPSTSGPGWKITHAASGGALWPNELTLQQAEKAVTELLALEGWERPYKTVLGDAALRAAAEKIMRRYVS